MYNHRDDLDLFQWLIDQSSYGSVSADFISMRQFSFHISNASIEVDGARDPFSLIGLQFSTQHGRI